MFCYLRTNCKIMQITKPGWLLIFTKCISVLLNNFVILEFWITTKFKFILLQQTNYITSPQCIITHTLSVLFSKSLISGFVTRASFKFISTPDVSAQYPRSSTSDTSPSSSSVVLSGDSELSVLGSDCVPSVFSARYIKKLQLHYFGDKQV